MLKKMIARNQQTAIMLGGLSGSSKGVPAAMYTPVPVLKNSMLTSGRDLKNTVSFQTSQSNSQALFEAESSQKVNTLSFFSKVEEEFGDAPSNLQGEALVEYEKKRLDDLLRKYQALKDSHYIIVKKTGKNVPMFVEYCRLSAGKAFGEQALLKNNEPMLRAATIKCTKDCHFAVMAKEDFQNILKNKIQKSKLD